MADEREDPRMPAAQGAPSPAGQTGWDPGGGQPPYLPPVYQPPRRPPLSGGIKALLVVLAALAAAFGIALAVLTASDRPEAAPAEPSSGSESGGGGDAAWPMLPSREILPYQGEPAQGTIAVRKKSGEPLSADRVFDKVSPSVVCVVSRLTDETGNESSGQATGIIASADGVILTNAHVVEDSLDAEVVVVLPDQRQYEAHILGLDRTTDLAALKISATGLSPAEFGSTGELKVGESVVAIGNADGLNYAYSLTGGYVSALDRPIAGHSGNGMTYIQTDAAINPGNSGGPLCNLYGQVVGINSSKIVTTGYEGIGFAIPMSKSEGILNELIQNGYVEGRTRLGVTCRAIPDQLADAYGLTGGVQIVSIADDSSLRDAPVQAGDVLHRLDGQDIGTQDDIYAVLQDHRPGDRIAGVFYQPDAGEDVTVTITLLDDRTG